MPAFAIVAIRIFLRYPHGRRYAKGCEALEEVREMFDELVPLIAGKIYGKKMLELLNEVWNSQGVRARPGTSSLDPAAPEGEHGRGV